MERHWGTMMATKSRIKVTKIDGPRLAFTARITREDLVRLHQKPAEFTRDTITDLVYIEEEGQNSKCRRAKATVRPAADRRWSYRHTLEIFRNEECIDRGRCTHATWGRDERLKISWNDFSWDLGLIQVRYLKTLNLTGAEEAYWAVRLLHSGKNPRVLGYVPDTTLRVFRYAVPLAGLSNGDAIRAIGRTDFGVTSSEAGDPVNKLIGRLTRGVDDEAWACDVPKVFGTVIARDPIEAEGHALRRARFAADLLTFALQSGASHFDTVYGSRGLDWDAAVSMAVVSTKPWLLLFEQETLKGWVRSTPLTFAGEKVELSAANRRMVTFLDGFCRVAEAGDATDQAQPGLRSEREAKIAKAVKTAVHWMAVAAGMSEEEDQFLPVWTALEAVLSAIRYPRVFGKKRKRIREALLKAIDQIEDPEDRDAPELSRELLKGRLLNETWPIRTRLELFAKTFGIMLQDGDLELLKRLSRVRGQAVHTGDGPTGGLRCEVAQLKYLVERLVIGASVVGIRAAAGTEKHKIKIHGIGPGDIGAATIWIDGKKVSYTLTFRPEDDGTHSIVILADGQIYDNDNSVIAK